jgi:hypothetical protein
MGEINIKEEIKERLSSSTISPKWKKIRNICGTASSVALLLVSPICPIALGVTAVQWITFGGTILGIVAGRAHMDKSKK